MRRKKGHSEHENLERWLLTYADMITLLMAFFIMMYSMSVLNLEKFRQVAFSIRSGIRGEVSGSGKAILGNSGNLSPTRSVTAGDTAGVSWQIIKPLVSYIEKTYKDKSVEMGEDNRGLVITLRSDQMLFKPGSSDINPAAYPVLDKIAEALKLVPNLVQIEGHTCNLPTNNSKYSSNWELSTARATMVLRYMVEKQHLPAERFSAAGYGSVRPVVPNNTDEGRKRNRRVEIVILRLDTLPGTAPKMQPRTISDPREAVIQRRME